MLMTFSLMQMINTKEYIDKLGNKYDLHLTTDDELKECENIFVQAFSKAYEKFTPEDLGVVDKAAFLHIAFSDVYNDFRTKTQYLFSATKDGKVIGFVGFKLTETPNKVYITQLAVDPEYWLRGVGKQLILRVFDQFKDANHLVIIARKINTHARDFYLSLGFTTCTYMHPGYNPERYIGYEWLKK